MMNGNEVALWLKFDVLLNDALAMAVDNRQLQKGG
ncbi:hypothetical protein BWQ96_06653 [Gracilariopsis chorda]|uniref:Uncharacterized protein n=1 Tax=Gracilariopsis chorda TaxID=448386 RepID=A0A2V3INE4_9FLOR|nr:hypothetical protein BWQ96_06653 [Gracilariopsis chorda]|eukprot:PXF43596.1 hypothetical protein BWQ96_06653 [Gracilariopsis chorda]